MIKILYRCVFIWITCTCAGQAFTLLPCANGPNTLPGTALFQAKKNKSNSGKGFGKPNVERTKPTSIDTASPEDSLISSQRLTEPVLLQSIAEGSNAVPTTETTLSAEERAKKLLREKYGLKTLAEERLDEKQLADLQSQRRRLDELKAKTDAGEDFDLISWIPGPVVQAVFAILRAGVAISGTAFIASGLGITLEAWSKTSGDRLPENIDSFIVNTIEPNFTSMLFVLLGFSVSFGLLAAAQLGSKSAQYRED